MLADTIPFGETRKFLFDSVDPSSQTDLLFNLKIAADNCLLITRLEKDLDIKEFQKVCSHIGKPKEFHRVARYSEQWMRQVIIVFESPQDKKYFMFIFRIVFPDYIVQEMSKQIKVFCMNKVPEDADIDFKEFFHRKFQDVSSVWLSTGAEIIATDYKLSKHPLMQGFLEQKVVVAEFPTSGAAFYALMQLNDATILHNDRYLFLITMFEADEEQRNFTYDKKEMQRLEDEAEKCEKHIDNYISKQMAMMLSTDQLKEIGFDKANAQSKSVTYFKLLNEQTKKAKVNELIKLFNEKPFIEQCPLEQKLDLAHQVLCLQESNQNQGPFTRLNEPLVFQMVHEVQRYWDYDHLKYTNKRDPNIDEIQTAIKSYNNSLGNNYEGLANECVSRKDIYSEKICCATHASSLYFMKLDQRNICREINKLTVASFCNLIGVKQGDQQVDPHFFTNPSDNKNKLNQIMPFLNSLQYYGRYKQKIEDSADFLEIWHPTADVGQDYEGNAIYRNVNWVYGTQREDIASQVGGHALYHIKIPIGNRQSVIQFKDDSQNVFVLPPFQVLRFVGWTIVPASTTCSREVKIFQFLVCDDYKNYIKWPRKDLIKGIQA